MITTMRFASGNEAVIDAALAAGCHFFAGYPVTPATEILEAAAEKFPGNGRVMVPTEGEIAAIHMVAGASLAGFRAMTATAPLGLSLMSEALSFFSGMTELPGVVVVQQRWGPGDGSLGPGQDGYNQATRACGHGDFKMIVLAPKNVQELVDLTIEAFDLADRYGLFVLVLGDQLLAIASEQYLVPPPAERPPRDVEFGQGNGLVLPELVAVDETAGDFAALERVGRRWERKFASIERDEPRAERLGDDGAVDVLIVAYGSLARIAEYALPKLREIGSRTREGDLRVGVLRPITLWPFPSDALRAAGADATTIVVAELSMGQMIHDVAEAIGRKPDHFVNWLGGRAPSTEEFATRVAEGLSEAKSGVLR
ncbi:MAG: 2-oxoglutarate/2-oxoacid ferredoxin oxidoreductase subunit alpha [Ilumatobacteraceae bacterium]